MLRRERQLLCGVALHVIQGETTGRPVLPEDNYRLYLEWLRSTPARPDASYPPMCS